MSWLFASGSQRIGASTYISSSNKYSGLIPFRIDWLDLLAVQGSLKSLLQQHNSKASFLQRSAFFMVQLSHRYMTTGKTIALTLWTCVGKTSSQGGLSLTVPQFHLALWGIYSQFSSVAQSCLTLCDPMNRSTPGLPVHHQLPSSLRLMSIESVMLSSHLILCHPLLLLPPIPPSIRVFSNESTLILRGPQK